MEKLLNEVKAIPKKARLQYDKDHNYYAYRQLMKEYTDAISWFKMCGIDIENDNSGNNKI